MTPEQFCYWLQGFSEIDGACPTLEEWTVIQDHLAEVFNKVTPDRSGGGGGQKPKVLTEQEIQRVIRETQPGITCSAGDLPPLDTIWPAPRYCSSGKIC